MSQNSKTAKMVLGRYYRDSKFIYCFQNTSGPVKEVGTRKKLCLM